MAHQNITFPSPKLVHGITKSVFKPTIIVANGYSEYRLQRQQSARFTWKIPGRTMLSADITSIGSFLSSVNYGLDSFNFVCPKDGQTYAVRFDGSGYDTMFEALNTSNTPVAEQLSDITLVQVFGEV